MQRRKDLKSSVRLLLFRKEAFQSKNLPYMKKHANIPIFIPHLGCPNQCVFCNQRSISGHISFEKEKVRYEIEKALSTLGNDYDVEIAFFGGSFTGIDRDLMIYLLSAAEEYIRKNLVSSVRLSTRPDYIDNEILKILSKFSVRKIELGIQSMDDEVLLASKRGHNAKTSENACKAIVNAGFELVGQMMIGLPSSTSKSEIHTANCICDFGAAAARVYPTVVFYDTELCQMSKEGAYTPLSVDEAVYRTKQVLDIFDSKDVPCIRVGLCASENLSSTEAVFAGPNHSAIGELAMSELFYDRIVDKLGDPEKFSGDNILIYVPKGAISKAIGQHKKNISKLKEKYCVKNIKVIEKESLLGYNIVIET